jgi:hypothetical protein
VALQIHPKLGRCLEAAAKTQRGVGGNRPPFAHDVVNARRWYPKGFRQRMDGQTERLQKLLAEYLAGMDRGMSRMCSCLILGSQVRQSGRTGRIAWNPTLA